MPLPNYGYFNREKKGQQQLLFEMPPEIREEEVEEVEEVEGSGDPVRMSKRRRGRITTGKMDIELERKLVFKDQSKSVEDRNAWKPPTVNREDLNLVRKSRSPLHADNKSQMRSTLDSFISGDKVRQIRKDATGGLIKSNDNSSSSIKVSH